MDVEALVDEILRALPATVREDDSVRERLARIVGRHAAASSSPKRPHRRKAGPFDPMAVYRESPDELDGRLADLDVEQLKDIIAEHGMDRSKLAMKWKSRDRLVELITSTVVSRTQKGDAFRKPGSDEADGG